MNVTLNAGHMNMNDVFWKMLKEHKGYYALPCAYHISGRAGLNFDSVPDESMGGAPRRPYDGELVERPAHKFSWHTSAGNCVFCEFPEYDHFDGESFLVKPGKITFSCRRHAVADLLRFFSEPEVVKALPVISGASRSNAPWHEEGVQSDRPNPGRIVKKQQGD
jgi:hypothetical protein